MARTITDIAGSDSDGLTIEGTLNQSGYSAGLGVGVAAIGDFNGDGHGDFVVAAPGLDFEGREDSGGAFVLFGGPDLAARIGGDGLLDLSLRTNGAYGDLDPSLGFFVQGARPDDILNATAAGDVDGDGLADLWLAAPSNVETTTPSDPFPTFDDRPGTGYILYGRASVDRIVEPGTTRIEVASLTPGRDVTVVEGEPDFVQAGLSLHGGGDLDGDGFADLVLGTPEASGVVYNPDGTVLVIPDIPDLPGVDFGDLPSPADFLGRVYTLFGDGDRAATIRLTEDIVGGDGSRGFYLTGFVELAEGRASPLAFYGGSIGLSDSFAFADLDGDGRDTLVIGAAFAGPTIEVGRNDSYVPGGVFVIEPARGAGSQAEYDLRDAVFLEGPRNGELSATGFGVANLGDIDGDGLDDIGVLAPLVDDGAKTNAGAFYGLTGLGAVLEGAAQGARLPLEDVAGFTLFGAEAGDAADPALDDQDAVEEDTDGDILASGMAALGDVTGDGIGDFAVGLPAAGGGRGHVYVLEGRLDPARPGAATDGLLDFAALGTFGEAAKAGGERNGMARLDGASGDWAGVALGGGLDLTGDGVPDLLVGATSALVADYSFETDGRVYLLSGGELFSSGGGGGSDGTIRGTPREDDLVGTRGDDTILGLAGADTIAAGRGNDTADAGRGSDRLDGGGGRDDLDGAGGSDIVRGGGGNDTVTGGEGNDVLEGGGGRDRLEGEDGNDDLSGGGGNDLLAGGKGRDMLAGQAGNDRLKGGEGQDTLGGGGGNDRLQGGGGADFFSFSAGDGDDIIQDFQDDTDTLVLSSVLVDGLINVAKMLNRFGQQDGDDVLLDLRQQTSILIKDADLDALRDDIDIA